MKSRTSLSLCAVLIVLVLGTSYVYAPILDQGFLNFDDPMYVTENPHVQDGLTLKGVGWALTSGDAANWHPLTWLSHMLDCELYGLDAAGHHLTSLLFHLANCVLLFVVLLRMTGALWCSAFTAAVFAFHPLRVESVAWVAERKDVLSTFLGFLSVGFYVQYVRRPRVRTYLALLLSFSLGLMAKPMLVTLPFLLLLLEIWPLRRVAIADTGRLAAVSPRWLVSEKLPLFLLSAASSTVTYLVQLHGGAVRGFAETQFGVRIANAAMSYGRYIGKTLWPQDLALVYPYAGSVLPAWQVACVVLFLAAVTLGVFCAVRKRPYLLVGWLWYVGMLVPVIGLVQVGSQVMADRYTYIPCIGLAILVTWGVADVVVRWRVPRVVVGAGALIVLVSLLVLTRLQVAYWHDGLTLFQHALNVSPMSDIAHFNMGVIAKEQGRAEQSTQHFERVIQLNPDYFEAHNNLGVIVAKRGEVQESLQYFQRAIWLRPEYVEAYNNLGNSLVLLKRSDAAERRYREAHPDRSQICEPTVQPGSSAGGARRTRTRDFSASGMRAYRS